MAISKTAIANRALAKVGESRVSDIDTSTKPAALAILDMWDGIRDSLLQSYPWNFAIKRATITKDTTAPDWEYSNRYTLPAGYLALLEIKNDPDYRIESGNLGDKSLFIVTDEAGPISIRYISRVEETGYWDAMFDESMAAQLAVEAAEIVTQSNTKKQILMAERDAIIKRAFASDAIQDPPQELRPDSWLTAREEGYDDEIDYSIT